MKKGQKTLVSSVAALASVAGIIAPSAAFAATLTPAQQDAENYVSYAEKTANFYDFNMAFAKVMALPAAQQGTYLARLAAVEGKAKTDDVKLVLTTMDSLAANKDLNNFYKVFDLVNKVTDSKNKQYLQNELNTWGHASVFTADVTTATDAIIKAWTTKDPADVTAAQTAINKITNAGSLAWCNDQIAQLQASMSAYVSSVTAINGSKIEIRFSKAVNSTDVIAANKLNTANIVIAAVGTGTAAITPANFGAVLSADKKVLTINTDTKLVGTYSVEVKDSTVGLADNPSTYFPGLVTTVSMTDTVKPTVTGVTYDNGTATVKFSEQLGSQGTISLDGVQLAAGATTLSLDTIQIPGLTPGKSYQLTIVGATDVAGNFITPNPATVSLNVPSDSVKPSVAVTTKNTIVTLDFSEEINTATGTVTIGSTVVSLSDPLVVQDSTDKTIYTYDASALVTGNFYNANVKVSGYKDKAGNTGDDLTASVSLNKDITAPKFVSATAKDAVIAAKFDEDVDPNALTAAAIKYTSPDNVVINLPAATLTSVGQYDVNGNTIIDGEDQNYLALTITQPAFLDSNSKLLPGTYQVTLASGTVQDKVPNATTAPVTFTVTVAAGSTVGQVVTVMSAAQVAGTPGSFEVTYNNLMGSSALLASNYKLDGVAIPSQSVLYFDGTKDKVRIELPAGYVNATGDRQFTVSNVLDNNGNSLKTGFNSAVIAGLLENVKPTATKLSLVSDSTLTVDLSEKLAALPATVNGLTVKVNGVKVTLTGTTLDAVTGKQITLTAAPGTFTAAQTITLEVAGTNVADLAGNTVTDVTLTK